MTIYANLVIGQDGSTTRNGSSKSLSSQEDRRRFHELRRKVNCIFIGGETARLEPYSKTPIPLVVVSKSQKINEISTNPISKILNTNPKAALEMAINEYGPDVLIEGGPNLLIAVLDLVDELYITLSKEKGDGQLVSFDGLTRGFVMEDLEKVDGEIFYKFKRPK